MSKSEHPPPDGGPTYPDELVPFDQTSALGEAPNNEIDEPESSPTKGGPIDPDEIVPVDVSSASDETPDRVTDEPLSREV